MQGRIGLLSTDNNSGSLKGGQPACVCVRTHLEAAQLEPPAVSNGDLP